MIGTKAVLWKQAGNFLSSHLLCSHHVHPLGQHAVQEKTLLFPVNFHRFPEIPTDSENLLFPVKFHNLLCK